jgi:FkbM family methyltransferase
VILLFDEEGDRLLITNNDFQDLVNSTHNHVANEHLFDQQFAEVADSIVLHGAGNLGRKTLQGLRDQGIEPKVFTDNNEKLWGSKIDGLLVCSPQEAAIQFGKEAVFVVTIWMRLSEHRFIDTHAMLTKLGCIYISPFAWIFLKYPDRFLPFWSLDMPSKLIEKLPQINEVWNYLSDSLSKDIFKRLFQWRLTLDFSTFPIPNRKEQYFNLPFFRLSDQETFIDCGAFDGDTIKGFLKYTHNCFSNIVAFEPDNKNGNKLTKYIESLPEENRKRIVIYPYALGNEAGQILFNEEGGMSSSISTFSGRTVPIVALQDILHVATYIKMDIEGAEYDAVVGAITLIKQNRPILAIAVYHKPDDLWRIAHYLGRQLSKYRYYLRSHAQEGEDTVLYAVPEEKTIK